MRRHVLGCNHRSAGVELRERLAFDSEATVAALGRFKEQFPTAEAVLLSTCNRMEIYWAGPDDALPAVADVVQFIASFHGVDSAELVDTLYHYDDIEMIRHLFRVSSSMDSMVLGESQILGQVKSAYAAARAAGTVGRLFAELFPLAFSTAKDVHTQTRIAVGRVSVGSTAVDLARQIFSRFDDKTICMAGAGKMGALTLSHLLATKPRHLWVTNRTDARSVELARRIRDRHAVAAEPIPFDAWIDRLADVDILISCTGAREPILTAAQFEPVPARRSYRPMLLIDIAVPRDIDPAVGENESVFLYNIDDLQTVTESALAHRRDAIRQCYQIIEANVLKCIENESGREFTPLIMALRRRFHQVAQDELDRIKPKLSDASDQDWELIAHMVHRIAQKTLHDPLELLHDKAADGQAHVYADALRALFKLHTDEPPEQPGG